MVEENGSVNAQLTAYIVTYVIVTNWVVLQVRLWLRVLTVLCRSAS